MTNDSKQLNHFIGFKKFISKIMTVIKRKSKQSLRFFKSSWEKCKAIEILEIIVMAATITGLVQGVDYFTKKSSLEIQAFLPFPQMQTFVYPKEIYHYYVQNKFPIPHYLRSFVKDAGDEAGTGDNSLNSAHKTIVDFIRSEKEGRLKKYGRSDLPSSFVKERAKDLESRLNIIEPDRQHAKAFVPGAFAPMENFSTIAEKCQKNLTEEEYYVFLAALIRSREIEQEVVIRNNGDVDLKNIRVSIPAPYSEVTESREGNIKELKAEEYQSLFFHEIKNTYADIKIPKLAKNREINLKVITRENQLNQEECASFSSQDYTAVKEIKWEQVIYCFLWVLVVMSMFFLFLKNSLKE